MNHPHKIYTRFGRILKICRPYKFILFIDDFSVSPLKRITKKKGPLATLSENRRHRNDSGIGGGLLQFGSEPSTKILQSYFVSVKGQLRLQFRFT